ncbi:MAG TPA: hypothetical protein VFD04_09580 [Actinomycetes bacterium]|nr:hypothetical protein [Actinomycetes bacterium]
MRWIREGAAFGGRAAGEPDGLRALRPWVLQEAGGRLRMWYSGHDGTTGRILAAARRPDGAWERLGVAIDAGSAGDSDQYGVESPCVVRTPGGYLMAYGGFDGEATRLHMATSDDGRGWTAQGTIMQRGPDEALGASHPCLLSTEAGWWLFFCGYDGSRDSRRAAILAAVSPTGASWDRVGVVLAPVTGEFAVSHPCVIQVARTFYMFYASDDGGRVSVAMATSANGCSWDRHGTVLAATGQGAEAGGVHSPCVVRLQDGSLHMWYAALAGDDASLAYQIHSARFPGPWSV